MGDQARARSAVTVEAVAGIASVIQEQLLAVFGVARR